MALLVLRANATGYSTVLAKSVAYTETYHSILVLGTLRQISQILADNHECIAIIEVVAIDYTEWLLDHVLTHQHSVVGAPRLLTALRYAESLWQCIECLEAELTLYLTLVLSEDLRTELLLEILTDNPYDLAEASLNGIVNTVIHDGLAVRTQTVELFQAAVTATHTSCKQK